MKKIIVLTTILSVLILAGCGGGNKSKNGDNVAELRAKLEKLNKDKAKLDEDIHQVQAEIEKADPASAKSEKKLVTADTIRKADFTHFIELTGKVDAENIVYVTPRGVPGQIRELHVKKGDIVRKGQLLVKLDDAVMLQSMNALETTLEYAENLYNRQKNLWDQGIGTEVQLLDAKNRVDNAKKQIATTKETWQTSFIYSPISGIADEVNVKVGEVFTGVNQIKLIDNNNLKMVTEVPENYISRVKKGTPVEVVVPESGKPAFKSTINLIGASVNANTRSFTTEARLPADPVLKPNQLATMRIQDYKSKDAIAVPVNTVQSDEKGKYVFVIEKSGDKQIARKKIVTVGESYGGSIEIITGLSGGEQLITTGYDSVYDGQVVSTSV